MMDMVIKSLDCRCYEKKNELQLHSVPIGQQHPLETQEESFSNDKKRLMKESQ
jgi:hypothetical protein